MPGLSIAVGEDNAGKIVVTLDCRALRVPRGYTEREVVGATLDCLRLASGAALDAMAVRVALKPDGQQAIGELFDSFLAHPKDKSFPWK